MTACLCSPPDDSVTIDGVVNVIPFGAFSSSIVRDTATVPSTMDDSFFFSMCSFWSVLKTTSQNLGVSLPMDERVTS